MFHQRRNLIAIVLGLVAAGVATPAARADFLYVGNADFTISRIDLATNAQTTLANLVGRSSPVGLALDAGGNLYAAEVESGRIDRITPGGAVSVFASGLYYPTSIAFDRAGNLFELGQTGEINRITPGGVVTRFADTHLNSNGLVIDGAGNLYAASYNQGPLTRITAAGVVSTFATGLTFGYPSDLTIDLAGNVYVADKINGIERITPGGVISVIAPLPSGNPTSLAIDAAGNLFLGDSFQGIKRITPSGVVSVVANPGPASIYSLAFQASPAAVPEPASIVLTGMGAVMGLGLAWRRRRSASSG